MPKGSPKPQTVASQKYQIKAGYAAKSYKLKKEVAEEFAAACEKMNVSQSAQLTEMMMEFVNRSRDM